MSMLFAAPYSHPVQSPVATATRAAVPSRSDILLAAQPAGRQLQSRGTAVPAGFASQAVAPRQQQNAEGLTAQDIEALQSRITAVERDLRDTGSLMKLESLNPFGASALSARAEQMQEQLKQARELRQDYEAKASRLEQLLQQERKEREAWLDTFSKALQKTLKDLSSCVDQSIAESNKLMKGKLDVADTTMHKIITQLNNSLSTPGGATGATPLMQARVPVSSAPRHAPGRASIPDDPADLVNSMSELLKENQLLQQKQLELMKQRSLRHGRRSQTGSGVSSGIASPSGGLVTSPGVALAPGLATVHERS